MPKKAKELSALVVGRLKQPGTHAVGGVAGLALNVQPSGARSWVLRLMIAGKRRELGLGGFPDVTLADVRRRAREEREKVSKGIDPVAEKQAAAASLKEERDRAITFEVAAKKYIEAHESTWRNAKHAEQWRNTLASTYPDIGSIDVSKIGLPEVLKVLEPIWKTKTETASRLRGRIQAVLDWATVRGHRVGANPARWRGHLDQLLPAPAKLNRIGHHPAMPIKDVGRFMADLREQDGSGARALEFVILTAARSGEVRGATWNEIDLEAGVWTIPGERMKAGRTHRVPLSDEAFTLLKALPQIVDTPYVFPAPRGGMLSDMTLVAVMRRMGVEAVPHGFRSTFRDWASERTNHPRDVAEMALAHAIGDKVEAAYRRGDLFEKRRRMMSEWAAYCGTVEPAAGKVVPLRRSQPAGG